MTEHTTEVDALHILDDDQNLTPEQGVNAVAQKLFPNAIYPTEFKTLQGYNLKPTSSRTGILMHLINHGEIHIPLTELEATVLILSMQGFFEGNIYKLANGDIEIGKNERVNLTRQGVIKLYNRVFSYLQSEKKSGSVVRRLNTSDEEIARTSDRYELITLFENYVPLFRLEALIEPIKLRILELAVKRNEKGRYLSNFDIALSLFNSGLIQEEIEFFANSRLSDRYNTLVNILKKEVPLVNVIISVLNIEQSTLDPEGKPFGKYKKEHRIILQYLLKAFTDGIPVYNDSQIISRETIRNGVNSDLIDGGREVTITQVIYTVKCLIEKVKGRIVVQDP